MAIINREYCKKRFREGLSCREIGKEIGVSRSTVYRRLVEEGIIKKRITKNKKQKGKKLSEEHKRKIRNTLRKRGIEPPKKNNIAWNKGKKLHYTVWNKGKKTGDKNWKNRVFDEKVLKKIRESRAKQVLPKKDTSIEVKLQNLLKRLGIEFYTHQYMKEIKDAYQCDILVPKQTRILKNGEIINIERETIIEAFGDYWHNRPVGREIDKKRTNQLLEKGKRVLVFWEHEINNMKLNDLKQKLK
ncbi:MAG: helix-turn-helix domain-containing protein [Promethearchaeota archaeon]